MEFSILCLQTAFHGTQPISCPIGINFPKIALTCNWEFKTFNPPLKLGKMTETHLTLVLTLFLEFPNHRKLCTSYLTF